MTIRPCKKNLKKEEEGLFIFYFLFSRLKKKGEEDPFNYMTARNILKVKYFLDETVKIHQFFPFTKK